MNKFRNERDREGNVRWIGERKVERGEACLRSERFGWRRERGGGCCEVWDEGDERALVLRCKRGDIWLNPSLRNQRGFFHETNFRVSLASTIYSRTDFGYS